jgi:membrane protein
MAEHPIRTTGVQPEPSRFGLRRIGSLTWNEISTLVKTTYDGWTNDNAPRLGASLAFYSLLSLAPIVIVVVAIAGMAFGHDIAQRNLMWHIRQFIGYRGAVAIQGLVESARNRGSGILATTLGVITLILGATAVVNDLHDSLNTIWNVPKKSEQSTWRSVWDVVRERLSSFAVVVGTGFLLMLSLLVSAWISAAGTFVGGYLPLPAWLLQTADWVISFLVITLLFGLLYKMLPDVDVEWGDVAVGAAVTSVLFTIGKFLIGLYLAKTSFASSYGAAGSLVIVLVWVYYSAQVFFFGAEFTCAYTRYHGSRFREQLKTTPAKSEARVVLPGEPPPRPDRSPQLVGPDGRTADSQAGSSGEGS